MIVIDASVWVSRFLPEDKFHLISRSWLIEKTVAGLTFVVPTIMLAEVSGAISRRVGDRQLGYQIVGQIGRLPTLQLVPVDNSLGQASAKIASNHRLRGADAIYVALAQRLQVPLISWDQEQINRVSNLIAAYTPSYNS